jgi:carbon-monoxide dehydrogenase large subunit
VSAVDPVIRGTARAVGARVSRVEDPRLLTGRGTFVDDVVLPGMVHACFVRSPHARARVRSIDVSAALALAGVEAVFTAADLNPRMKAQWHDAGSGPNGPETPRPPLAEDEVRFVGDQVALVLATSRYVAEDAAALVEVDYEPLPAVVDFTTAELSTDLVHEGHGSNLIERLGRDDPDVDALFETAHHVTCETISQHPHAAVPMEGRGLVVDRSPDTGNFTVYSGTQAPHDVRAFCARLVGIPPQRVRVVARDTGGGFGQKIYVQREEMCIMLAALLVEAPIKWIEDRQENLMAAGKSRREQATARLAFDPDGVIQAAQIHFVSDCGAYPTPWPSASANVCGILFPGPYRVPRASYTSRTIYTNTAGRSAYRGPWQFETLSREMLYDIAAREMGCDPVQLRRTNLLRSDEMPFPNPNGWTYDRVSPLETFDAALAAFDYDAFRCEQAAARNRGRYLGVGVANFIESTTSGMGAYGTEAATIRIEPSGHVNVYIAGGSTGNSIETAAAQLTAAALGVDISLIEVVQGDTALSGYGAGTAGSRSGSMLAGAIRETTTILRERVVAIAANMLEAAPEDVDLVDGRAAVRGTSAIGVPLAAVAREAYFNPRNLPPGVPAGLEATARYTAESIRVMVNATHICACEVEVATGRVSLLRHVVGEDCGPMINPNLVEGQIAGGTVQGMGGVLYEHLVYDADGNPLATTFMDYLLPTTTEIPPIEYVHVETPALGPGGYKGVGEGGAIGAPAAVVNAVADALAPLGVKITRLPLGPSDLLDLIERATDGRERG